MWTNKDKTKPQTVKLKGSCRKRCKYQIFSHWSTFKYVQYLFKNKDNVPEKRKHIFAFPCTINLGTNGILASVVFANLSRVFTVFSTETLITLLWKLHIIFTSKNFNYSDLIPPMGIFVLTQSLQLIQKSTKGVKLKTKRRKRYSGEHNRTNKHCRQFRLL